MSMPTENVGSLPRPSKLQAAIKAYDAGRITKDELVREQDEACRDSIVRMEATGAPIVSDGEQHQSSFATYPLADTLAGTGMNEKLVPGGQYFAFFADGHNRQLPKLTDGRFRYNTYAASYVEKAVRIAKKPLKQAVIAPSMLALLYPLDGKVEGYSRAQFLEDVCDECERDIRQCFAAGAERVSMDFTEGRLACRKDPRNPWTGRGMLPSFVELNNRVLNRFSAEERRNIGIHTCPGGDCDFDPQRRCRLRRPAADHVQDERRLLPHADVERTGPGAGLQARRRAHAGRRGGVAQVCFIGVTNPLNPRVETPEEVADALVRAANHIPKERLGATDDCGFSPFSIDEKPRHGSPDQARDVAFQKIAARVQGTRMASARLGLGSRGPPGSRLSRRRRRSSRCTAPGIGRVRMRGAEQQRTKVGRVQPVRQFAPQHAAFGRRALAGDDGDAAHPVRVRVGKEASQRAVRLVHAAPVQIQDALRPGAAAPQVAPAPRVQPARRGADPELGRRARRLAGGAAAGRRAARRQALAERWRADSALGRAAGRRWRGRAAAAPSAPCRPARARGRPPSDPSSAHEHRRQSPGAGRPPGSAVRGGG